MSVPMLQVAMDYITLPPALAMAAKVAAEVDIIEIGTPLRAHRVDPPQGGGYD